MTSGLLRSWKRAPSSRHTRCTGRIVAGSSRAGAGSPPSSTNPWIASSSYSVEFRNRPRTPQVSRMAFFRSALLVASLPSVAAAIVPVSALDAHSIVTDTGASPAPRLSSCVTLT